MPTDKQHCIICNKIPSQPYICIICNKATYCSKECRAKDTIHYITCVTESPFIKDGHFITQEEFKKSEGPQLKLADFEPCTVGSMKTCNIGKGSYGEVILMKHKSLQKQFAVKLISKRRFSGTLSHMNMKDEIAIHRRLVHENIIRMYANLEDDKYEYLILEYAPKGNLFSYIKSKRYLSETEAFYFFMQACSGIYFLHVNGYVHRDIKPENLLITEDGMLKICDFGWCTQISGKRFHYYLEKHIVEHLNIWHLNYSKTLTMDWQSIYGV